MTNKKLIIFTDSGDTIIDEATQVRDARGIVLTADFIPGAGEVLKKLHDDGYTVALVVVCVVREFLGSGTFGGGLLNNGEGIRILPEGVPAMQMVMPVGGFLTLGFVVAGYQWFMRRQRNKKKEGVK